MKRLTLIAITSFLAIQISSGNEVLTLERCKELALQGNDALKQEQINAQMASYDKKIAAANYFPKISVKGGYMHNGDNISLISDQQSAMLGQLGTAAQSKVNELSAVFQQAMAYDPSAQSSLMWKTFVGALSQLDVSQPINMIANELNNALHMDIKNVGGGVVSLEQPIFVGGKIVVSNQIAKLAQELAQYKYDEKYNKVIIDVENSYWQVVSISAKKRLSEDYADLLKQLLKDANSAKEVGAATESDILSIKVKSNEAEMMRTRATNGLRLAKMLLCKQIGLPLESEITLADENTDKISEPTLPNQKSMEEIIASRPELRQLEVAEKIFDKKVKVTRADGLPKIALTANYLYTNPNLLNGFQNNWRGTWNAGVVVSIPIFHGTEIIQKTKKAKAEAQLYKLKYNDAKKMIDLQVNQLRCQYDEALERQQMSESNLKSAEENLRKATVGYEEGVINASTAMAAQSAWLKAHSEYIDASIELQMIVLNINNAEGNRL